MKYSIGFVVIVLVVAAMMSSTTLAVASDPASASATVIPQLIRFSGVAKGTNGQPLTSRVGITFALYADQQGGSPLWLETQSVQLDSHGNYTVQLGATLPNGLPAALFATGEARWVGVQISGQEEQPRVMLLSVPYAMKAGDAQTLNGQPASAFLTASGSNAANPNGVNNNAISGGGTTDYVPLVAEQNQAGQLEHLSEHGRGPGHRHHLAGSQSGCKRRQRHSQHADPVSQRQRADPVGEWHCV